MSENSNLLSIGSETPPERVVVSASPHVIYQMSDRIHSNIAIFYCIRNLR
jgi:hypothetical protein